MALCKDFVLTPLGKIQEFGFEGIIAKDRHPTGFYNA